MLKAEIEPMPPRLKRVRVELGLAILAAVAMPGASFSHQEIALWCGCDDGAIWLIEKLAMKKLRKRILFGDLRRMGKELAA
jgi:hypothetical protein